MWARNIIIFVYFQALSDLIPSDAKKVNFHDIEDESILYTRSGLDPLSQNYVQQSETNDGDVESKSTNNSKTNSNRSNSPFISTTLKTTLAPIPTTSISSFSSDKQAVYSEAYAAFLEHVLAAQEVYDVNVLAVNIFDEELISLTINNTSENADGGRDLLTNALQFHFENGLHQDDDDNENNDEYDDDEQESSMSQANNPDEIYLNKEEYSALQFSVVVSAQHLLEENYGSLNNEQFQKIVIHISNKFHSHLLDYIQKADFYYRFVETVVVEKYSLSTGYNEDEDTIGHNVESSGFFTRFENHIRTVEKETLNTWSIIGIVVGGIMIVALGFATIKIYRREQLLKRNRWRSQEIANSNINASFIKSLQVLRNKTTGDDYSFDPINTNDSYSRSNHTVQQRSIMQNRKQHSYTDYADVPLNNNDKSTNEEIAFSSVWPPVSPVVSSPLFHGAPPLTSTTFSLDEEINMLNDLNNSKRQHVYAPPGKVGVAIDIYNGQPVVHKVKKGSPLEGLLQPMDIVVAIDDVDTNCMSAADVTNLMVKRMNYRRKITFIRQG